MKFLQPYASASERTVFGSRVAEPSGTTRVANVSVVARHDSPIVLTLTFCKCAYNAALANLTF